MQSIEIIKLAQEHYEMLIDLFNKINIPRYVADFSPHPFDKSNAKRICNYSGDDFYFALLKNKIEIIGYFMLRGWDEKYEIPSIGLCVLDDYQGFGLGRMIMNFLETTALLNNASQVMLKVVRENRIALNLYESQGFKFKDCNEVHLIGYKSLVKR